MELPFTLTHPKPKERVISQVVTLPPRSSLSSFSDVKGEGEGSEVGVAQATGNEASGIGKVTVLI